MKVIIAAGKDFKDYDLLKQTCDKALSRQDEVEIVLGNTETYALGKQYAEEPSDRKVTVHIESEMPLFTNIAKYADALIVFWDGSNKNMETMISTAHQHKLKVKVIVYEPEIIETPKEKLDYIALDENYRLESDSNQWTLLYEKSGEINPKTKKPTISSNKWYCVSLEAVLRRYVNECPKPSKTSGELMLALIRIEKLIEKIEL